MIPVTKYHGCGNDFIITDWELLKHKNIEDFVKHVCDRHTGIGADGCILVKQKLSAEILQRIQQSLRQTAMTCP